MQSFFIFFWVTAFHQTILCRYNQYCLFKGNLGEPLAYAGVSEKYQASTV